MSSLSRVTAHLGAWTAVGLAAALGATVLAAPATAATADPPSMPTTFTTTTSPLPSFVASAGDGLSLTRQTVPGLAAQRYGTTPGLTAAQAGAAEAGFVSSLPYPGTAGTSGTVVASAVGVLAAGPTPLSSSAPGCSANTGGAASRVTLQRDGATSILVVSSTQQRGFTTVGSWTLPTSGARPTDVAVLETDCGSSRPSAVAVTSPGRIDWYAFDGRTFSPRPTAAGVLRPTATWTPPPTVRVLASAHVNADTSLLSVPEEREGPPDVGNGVLLAVTNDDEGAVTLHHLSVGPFAAGGAWSVSDSTATVGPVGGGTAVTASVAYDNLVQGGPSDAAYAVAVRRGSVNELWFGTLGRGAGQPAVQQPGGCVGSDLPRVAVTNAPNDRAYVGVVCTVTRGSATVVQRYSDFDGGSDDPSQERSFPSVVNGPATVSLPKLTGVTPFVSWPCVLLSRWGSEQSPSRSACSSDVAGAVIGTPAGGSATFHQLPAVGTSGNVVSAPVAGATPGAVAVVDQVPLARTTLTVRNSSATAVRATTPPRPVAYVMPAPMVTGLQQPVGSSPTSFGSSASQGSGREATFSTSLGATVSASIGIPDIASLDLSASAEKATGTSDSQENDITRTIGFSSNDNEPFVVYLVAQAWQWTGRVVADSTGIATRNDTRVLTQVAAPSAGTAELAANSVEQLRQTRPAFFGPKGVYAPSLRSVFGDDVFAGSGRTVVSADPRQYPSVSTNDPALAPMVGRAPYCDTYAGTSGVTTVNSGVRSPYTRDDVVSGGAAVLTSGAATAVTVGDALSDVQAVEVSSSRTTSYSTEFSVNASAGVTIGGMSATVESGFSVGNSTSVSTASSQTFTAEIGHIRGLASHPAAWEDPASPSYRPDVLPNANVYDANRALSKSQRYSWLPFLCRRTTPVLGGGQTAALVMGFATTGLTGLSEVPATAAPTAVTGGVDRASATRIAAGGALAFTRSGPSPFFRVRLDNPATGATVWVDPAKASALTPAQAVAAAAQQTLRLPALSAGTWSWTPYAYSYTGDEIPAAAPRWITVG